MAPTTAGSDTRPTRRRHFRIVILAGAAVSIAAVALALFQPWKLFVDDRVDEATPTFAPATGEPEGTAPKGGIMDPASAPDTTNPVVTTHRGSFRERSHPGNGDAVVLTNGSSRRVLRFEGFETDNGPDLHVYLSAAPPDADAGAFDDDFVTLGRLKGNVGDQNYELPADVDLARYPTVVVWCDRFDVAFTVAVLTSA